MVGNEKNVLKLDTVRDARTGSTLLSTMRRLCEDDNIAAVMAHVHHFTGLSMRRLTKHRTHKTARATFMCQLFPPPIPVPEENGKAQILARRVR